MEDDKGKTDTQAASVDPDCYESLGTETEFIELNMSNYDEDDVSQLNAWAIEADALIERLKVRIRDAFRTGYHAGHNDTVEGGFSWCNQGSTERADDWFEDEFGIPCPEPWGFGRASD